MKRDITITELLLLFIIFCVFLSGCGQIEFTGNRVANPDSYSLDIEHMVGTDTHKLELGAGEVLLIHFETEKGFLHMKIKAPDGTICYEGSGKEAMEFTVNILVSGVYSIEVEARRAKGKIFIGLKGDAASNPEDT